MNRHMLQPFCLRRSDHGLERLMAIDVRLQVVLQNQVHRSHFGIHDYDRQRDTCFAQLHAFVRHSDRQVIHHSACLERFGHFDTSCSVRKGFYHACQFRLRFQQPAEIAHILHQRREVHFEHRLMGLVEYSRSYQLLVVTQRPHHSRARPHVLVRRIFDDLLRVNKQFHLLRSFLFQRDEVLVVFVPDVRDYAYGRTNDRFQLLHLTGLRNSCLKEAKERLFQTIPQGMEV